MKTITNTDPHHNIIHMFVLIAISVSIVLGIVLLIIFKIIEKVEKKNSIKTNQTEVIDCICDPEGAHEPSCQRCSEITIV